MLYLVGEAQPAIRELAAIIAKMDFLNIFVGTFFGLNELVDLFPVDADVLGGLDSNFDLPASHAEHSNFDIIVDPDGLTGLPLDMKHKVLLVCCGFIQSREWAIPRPKKTHRWGGKGSV